MEKEIERKTLERGEGGGEGRKKRKAFGKGKGRGYLDREMLGEDEAAQGRDGMEWRREVKKEGKEESI